MNRTAHLVYLPGYPFDIETLTPRHRLAAAAGRLLQSGVETQILDFGTVDGWAGLYPEGQEDCSRRLLGRVRGAGYGQPLWALKELWPLHQSAKAFRSARQAWAADRVEWLCDNAPADAYIFEVADSEDIAILKTVVPLIRDRRPGQHIGIFGPLVTRHPTDITRRSLDIDAAFPEHAEESIAKWIEVLDERGRWAEVPNTLVRPGKKWIRGPRNQNTGESCAPAYGISVYPAIAGDNKLKVFTVEDYRGCNCHCNACTSPHSGIAKSTDAVNHEISLLSSMFGATAIHLAGAGAPASHVLATAQAVEQPNTSHIRFSRSLHAAHAVPALFSGLKRAGCVSVDFRIGTGSQRLLDGVFGHGLKVSHTEKVAFAAHEHGIAVHMHMIYPMPDDDYHTRAETIRLITRTRPHGAPVQTPGVSESSHWAQESAEYGFLGIGMPGPATFPLPPDRWRRPAQGCGPFSPSQAVQHADSLRGEIEQTGTSTILTARRTLIAEVAGAALRPAAFINSFLDALATGDETWVREAVARCNGHACFAAETDSIAPMRPAVGDNL